MSNELIVDYSELTNLKKVMNELVANLQSIRHFNELTLKAVGNSRMHNALRNVDNIWNNNRRLLTDRISELAEDAEKVVAEFQATDRKLYMRERSLTAGELLG